MARSLGSRPRPRRGRLSHSGDFERVLRHGRSHGGRELVLHVFPRAEQGPTRLGLSVSRKVGGAVERNRVKRLLREAFAREAHRLPSGTDVVLVARRDVRDLAEREGLSGVQKLLGELISRVEGAATATPQVEGARPRSVADAPAGTEGSSGARAGTDGSSDAPASTEESAA